MQLSWTLKISGVALAAMLSACGEVKGTGTDGGGSSGENDFTLTVDPTSLSIPIAGSATVTVNVARTGTVGEIVLTAEGLGASLTADLPPIAADASNGQVTINVAGGSLPAVSTVTITGTAAGKTHSATVEVTTKTITVTGTVRGGRSGVKVGIIGKQSVTSGAGTGVRCGSADSPHAASPVKATVRAADNLMRGPL